MQAHAEEAHSFADASELATQAIANAAGYETAARQMPAPVVKAEPVPIIIQRPEGIDQMDWSALHDTVSDCQACTLCGSRQNTVFGVGAPAEQGQAPQVDWLIVGEAPGENEDLQGEPFVGQAGKLLDNMLGAMKLSRMGERTADGGGVFIANVLKCRPPGNRNPKPEEVAQCLPYLERQVALLKPKMVLAMGRFAVQALLRDTVPDVDTTPLGKLRGRVHQYQGVPVVVTYHPAYVLRNLPEKAKVWADLCLALAHLKGSE
jgi:DNA polymerase